MVVVKQVRKHTRIRLLHTAHFQEPSPHGPGLMFSFQIESYKRWTTEARRGYAAMLLCIKNIPIDSNIPMARIALHTSCLTSLGLRSQSRPLQDVEPRIIWKKTVPWTSPKLSKVRVCQLNRQERPQFKGSGKLPFQIAQVNSVNVMELTSCPQLSNTQGDRSLFWKKIGLQIPPAKQVAKVANAIKHNNAVLILHVYNL